MVLRMIIGGSTGLIMMIAFPCFAPPISSSAFAVVSVNSSTFARVPGPADFDAMEATISAYSTGTTLEIAATTGVVACPAQVIILMFLTFSNDERFTTGAT